MGDTLLIELAELLERCVRTNRDRPDIVGRLGGDEFLVVLPGADEFAGLLVVERLAETLSTHSFRLLIPDEHRPPPAVGYSLGIATAPADGTDPTALLAVADRAMYRAKRGTTGPIRFIARHAPAPTRGIAS